MKPGDIETLSRDETVSFDERALFDPTESATHDDAFIAQRQKTERLNQYYDEVVAELRALLDQSEEGD